MNTDYTPAQIENEGLTAYLLRLAEWAGNKANRQGPAGRAGSAAIKQATVADLMAWQAYRAAL